MPQRAATIESLPMAFEVVKEMQADGRTGARGIARSRPARANPGGGSGRS